MFDFYEKRKMRHVAYSWPALIVLVLFCGVLLNGVWGVYKQERETRINKNQRLTHLTELEGRKTSLEDELNRLETSRGIEEEIRQKFEVGRIGEEVIVIVESPENTLGAGVQEKKGIFGRFLDIVLFR